jgi:hypothetical protein
MKLIFSFIKLTLIDLDKTIQNLITLFLIIDNEFLKL